MPRKNNVGLVNTEQAEIPSPFYLFTTNQEDNYCSFQSLCILNHKHAKVQQKKRKKYTNLAGLLVTMITQNAFEMSLCVPVIINKPTSE